VSEKQTDSCTSAVGAIQNIRNAVVDVKVNPCHSSLDCNEVAVTTLDIHQWATGWFQLVQCKQQVLDTERQTETYSVSRKISPQSFFNFIFQRLKIFKLYFTRIFSV